LLGISAGLPGLQHSHFTIGSDLHAGAGSNARADAARPARRGRRGAARPARGSSGELGDACGARRGVIVAGEIQLRCGARSNGPESDADR
jgi:hypothetical protein